MMNPTSTDRKVQQHNPYGIVVYEPYQWVCKVFVTISATLECFMLLIVVGTLRVPSLQKKYALNSSRHSPSAVPSKKKYALNSCRHPPSAVPSKKNMLLIVVGTLRVPSLQKKICS